MGGRFSVLYRERAPIIFLILCGVVERNEHTAKNVYTVYLHALSQNVFIHILRYQQIKGVKAMGADGVGTGAYGGGVWTSTAAILVLFILLVIITKAIWV